MAATSRDDRQVRTIRCPAGRLVPNGAQLQDASTGPGKTTADADIVEARFIDIVPGVRVVQGVTFVADDPDLAGTMTMTWQITAIDDGNLAAYVQRRTT
jgi:hypothetical protein